MQLDRIPASDRSPAGPQSNQNVPVLSAISRDVQWPVNLDANVDTSYTQ